MKKLSIIITCLILLMNTVCAGEILPQKYSSTDPYKDDPWFKQIKISQPNFGKIQPDMHNSYSQMNDISQSKYSNVLSRMEREWLRQEYNNYKDEDRISQLEEKVFGTIHDGDIDTRCDQLKKAFDVRKSIQAKHERAGRRYFSGVPTSIPMNANNVFGY